MGTAVATGPIAPVRKETFHFDLGSVICEDYGKHLVLTGTVISYYAKQMAQESIRQAKGVREIHNELVVNGRSFRMDENEFKVGALQPIRIA